jgi:hypothetical protein
MKLPPIQFDGEKKKITRMGPFNRRSKEMQ